MKRIFLLLLVVLFAIPSFGQDKLPKRQKNGKLKLEPVSVNSKQEVEFEDDQGWLRFMQYGDLWSDRLAKKYSQLEDIQQRLDLGKEAQDSTLEGYPSYQEYSARLDSIKFKDFESTAALVYDGYIDSPDEELDSVSVYITKAGRGTLRTQQGKKLYDITHVSSSQVQVKARNNSNGNGNGRAKKKVSISSILGSDEPVTFTRISKSGKTEVYKHIDALFGIHTLVIVVK